MGWKVGTYMLGYVHIPWTIMTTIETKLKDASSLSHSLNYEFNLVRMHSLKWNACLGRSTYNGHFKYLRTSS